MLLSPALLVPLIGTFILLGVLLVVGKIPFGYNLRNLIVRWRTTVMTGTAFTLVVAVLILMLAFVKGMDRLSQGSGQPGNVIILSDGATDELVSTLHFSDSSDVDRLPDIMRDAKNRPLSSREVYLVVNQPVTTPQGEKPRRRFVQVRGIEDPLITSEVHGMTLTPGGSWFAEAGVRDANSSPQEKTPASTKIEAVLGQGIARELGRDIGKNQLEVGDDFNLGPRRWVVSGIMQSAGSTFDSEVWAKRELVGPMFGKEDYSTIVVRTRNEESARRVAADITTNFKKAAFQAQPEVEYFAKLSETNKQFLAAFIFLAAVMAIGGVFGVMNTMFAAISQRTKDIGVLRLVGFARWQILVSFFVESIAIALAGGILGCALGYAVDGWTATSIMSSGMGGGGKFVVLKLVVDANTIAAGLLFSLLMGGLGGLLPALSAMRLKPLDSLR